MCVRHAHSKNPKRESLENLIPTLLCTFPATSLLPLQQQLLLQLLLCAQAECGWNSIRCFEMCTSLPSHTPTHPHTHTPTHWHTLMREYRVLWSNQISVPIDFSPEMPFLLYFNLTFQWTEFDLWVASNYYQSNVNVASLHHQHQQINKLLLKK